MAAMESFLDVVDQRSRIPIEIVQRHVDLKDLLAIAHFGGTLDPDWSVEPAAQPPRGLPLELREQRSYFAARNARSRAVMGAADFVAEITGQHAPGRKNRGCRRHDDALDLQFTRHLRRVQAGRAAKTQ